MAHNVETMAYAAAGGVPWHRLGVSMGEGVLDVDSMIRAAGMEWEPELLAVYARTAGYEREPVALPEWRAVVRSDTHAPLGVVSDGYVPLSNRDAFDFLGALLADGQVQIESAGVLRGGREVWVLARIPEGATIAGEAHRGYILVTTGHDGAHAVTIRPTLVRVICNNTLNMALAQRRDALTFRIQHTRSLPERLKIASAALQMTTEAQRAMAERLEAFARTQVPAEALERLCAELFPVGEDGKRGPRVAVNFERFRGVMARNVGKLGTTAYGVLQGVTDYVDHHRVRDVDTLAGAERRFATSVISGTGVDMKARAFRLLSELAS